MANHKVEPESRTCPSCGTIFEVGGRDRPPKRQVYCKDACRKAGRVYATVEPETRPCKRDGCPHTFLVGGRGNGRSSKEYCSRRCNMLERPPLANPGSHAPRPKKGRDTLHNEKWLRERYLDEKLGASTIAKIVGDCSPQAVIAVLRTFNIPRRSQKEAARLRNEAHAALNGRRTVTQIEMITAYGGRCACCGETSIRSLSLDHKHGGGTVHRRSIGGQRKLRQYLRDQGWPTDDYQVLCMNCQFETRYGHICHHQRPVLPALEAVQIE